MITMSSSLLFGGELDNYHIFYKAAIFKGMGLSNSPKCSLSPKTVSKVTKYMFA